jgi:hypothetical protein
LGQTDRHTDRQTETTRHIVALQLKSLHIKINPILSLESLDDRRDKLGIKFAKKAERNPKFKKWFKPKPKIYTREVDDRYWETVARTGRLRKSPIPFLTDLLNENYRK